MQSEKKEKNKKIMKPGKKQIALIAAVLIILGLGGGLAYWYVNRNKIYTDEAEVYAPIISLSPEHLGVLEDLYVRVGDKINPNTAVARVGNELVKSKTEGLVVSAQGDIGENYSPGQSVVDIVNPNELRVIAHLDENKGLKDVHVGQKAEFSVDAYGSQKYIGTVDEIGETSNEGDVVFNISDKRQIKQFDVKIRFNPDAYPELKNGMSAKVWIYKN